jgi:hypothetical protein
MLCFPGSYVTFTTNVHGGYAEQDFGNWLWFAK